MMDLLVIGLLIAVAVDLVVRLLRKGKGKGKGARSTSDSAVVLYNGFPATVVDNQEESLETLRRVVAYTLGIPASQVTDETVLSDNHLLYIALSATSMFSRSIFLNEGDTFGNLARQCLCGGGTTDEKEAFLS